MRDRLRGLSRDVAGWLETAPALAIGGRNCPVQRIGQRRGLAVLDALQHDVVALYDVVEPQVPYPSVADQLVGQAGAQVARPAAARAARQGNAHAHANAACRQRLPTGLTDDALLLGHSRSPPITLTISDSATRCPARSS